MRDGSTFLRASFVLGAGLTTSATASGQGWLDSARWYAQPDAGEFRYFSNLDLDGFDDLIWFERTPGSSQTSQSWEGFRPFHNDGAGDFPTAGALVAFPANGNRFVPLDSEGVKRMRDLTGDGLDDVIVLERTPSFADVALHVYPANGFGGFGAPHVVPLAGNLDGIALGNADADPQFEIAVVVHSGPTEQITWRNFNGTSFVASVGVSFLSAGPFGQPRVARLSSLDLEGDGDDDLVFGESSSHFLHTYPTVGGAPTAGTSVNLPLTGSTNVHPIPVDLVGGGPRDLLAIATSSGSSIAQFVPIHVQSGTLAPGIVQSIQGWNGAAVWGGAFDVGDWDADGAVDLMYYPWQEPGGTTEGIVAFFENDGANGFSSAPVAKAELVYSDYLAVGPSDLDHDGHLDFVGKQHAYFGRGRFESSLVEVVDWFFGGAPRAVLDLEGDGDLDLFFDSTVHVAVNDGTGAYPGNVFAPAAPAGTIRQPATAIGDFTGDGRPDFLTPIFVPAGQPFLPPVFSHMRLYAWNGVGGYADLGSAATVLISPSNSSIALAIDVDTDGDTDVVGSSGYWPNHGNGTFGPKILAFASTHEPCAAGDLDSDGDNDFVAVYSTGNGGELSVQFALGGGAFLSASIPSSGDAMSGRALSLGDADLDGDLDLLAAASYADKVHVYVNDGFGGFSIAASLDSDPQQFGSDPALIYLAFTDVDGDGVLDVIGGAEALSNDDPKSCAVFRGLGGFAYDTARFFASGVLGPAADLDSDGDLDLSGRAIVRNRHYDGPDDGITRQYGSGTVGSGGATPLLGARGPLRPGSTTAELRLRLALGGTPLALYVGFAPAAITNAPFPGATFLIQPPIVVLGVVAGGAPGGIGLGAFDVPMGAVLPSLVGLSIYTQCGFVDPGAPGGKSMSNAVALTFGL